MTNWTQEAKDYLEGYLAQVGALAKSQGQDAEDIVASLREHILFKTEDDAGPLVTLEQLRSVLADVGSPDEILAEGVPATPIRNGGAESRPPAPPPPNTAPVPPTVVVQRQPRSKILTCAIVALIVTIISPVLLAFFGIVAAIVLPALSRARHSPDEMAAMRVLKEIAAAEKLFLADSGHDADGDGRSDYGTLEQLYEAGLTSKPYATEGAGPYVFALEIIPTGTGGGPAFTCAATPMNGGVPSPGAGRQSVSIDNTGSITFAWPKTSADPS